MKRRGKRINWTPIALTCLGLGAATGGLALALTQNADPTAATAPLRAFGESLQRANQSLHQADVVATPQSGGQVPQRGARAGNAPGDEPSPNEQTRTAQGSGQGDNELPEVVVAPLMVAPAVSGADAGTAPAAGQLTDAGSEPITDAGATELTPDAAQDAVPLEEEAVTALAGQPPPGAEQGMTYCGMATCNVGFKCCCDRCTPYEDECHAPECDVFTGLSVSVSCGMDLCDPGEICCDPSCAACSEAGQCPEQPCE